MIRLDLSGCTVASFTAGGGFHVVDVKRRGTVCTAARKMLALGVHPAEKIDVRRDGRPVFDRCKTVQWRAARAVVEDGEQGVRIRLLRPTDRPHSANSAFRPPREECPEAKVPLCAPPIPEGAT
jgi:hypothetical protein